MTEFMTPGRSRCAQKRRPCFLRSETAGRVSTYPVRQAIRYTSGRPCSGRHGSDPCNFQVSRMQRTLVETCFCERGRAASGGAVQGSSSVHALRDPCAQANWLCSADSRDPMQSENLGVGVNATTQRRSRRRCACNSLHTVAELLRTLDIHC